MAYLAVILLVGFITIDRLHRAHLQNRTLVSKYRLYELRDHLRTFAIRGQVNPRNWGFQYLDSAISRTISGIGDLNFWRVVAVALTYRRDERYLKLSAQLENELAKPKNAPLLEVNKMYFGAIMLHMLARHSLLRWLLRNWMVISSVRNAIRTKLSSAVTMQAHEPSTLVEFAEAA